MAQPAETPRRSLWIPFVYVGCMMLVFVTNGVLIWKALSTFPGLTTDHAYEQGRLYNSVLEEAARQDAIGLSVAVTQDDGRIRLTITQKDGSPATDAQLEGQMARPLNDERVQLDFTSAGAGQWIAAPAAPLQPGQWDIHLTTQVAAGKVETTQRLILR